MRGLRRLLAEAYLSERAARKKELAAAKAKEAALREMQKTLEERVTQAEAQLDLLKKAEQSLAVEREQTRQWKEKVGDGLYELDWRSRYIDFPGKRASNCWTWTR